MPCFHTTASRGRGIARDPNRKVEAGAGIEPALTALQAAASPLCHPAFSGRYLFLERQCLERETRFELATPTLARLCSTTELFPQRDRIVNRRAPVSRPNAALLHLVHSTPSAGTHARRQSPPQGLPFPFINTGQAARRYKIIDQSVRVPATYKRISPIRKTGTPSIGRS